MKPAKKTEVSHDLQNAVNRATKAMEENSDDFPVDPEERNFRIAKSMREKQLSLFEQKGIPLTPEYTSPMNNHIARTSIFAPIKRGTRSYHKGTLLYSQPGVLIKYHGEQLDMADQDTLLYAYHIAAGSKPFNDLLNSDAPQEMYFPIKINRAEFLRALGKSKTGPNYQWLHDSFFRLGRAHIYVETKHFHDQYPLILGPNLDVENQEYTFAVPLSSYMFFLKDQIGYVNRQRRLQLRKRVDMAKWLQTYAVSHAKTREYSIQLEKLKNLCGLSGRPRDLRKSVQEALHELVRVGELEYGEVDEDYTVRWKRIEE